MPQKAAKPQFSSEAFNHLFNTGSVEGRRNLPEALRGEAAADDVADSPSDTVVTTTSELPVVAVVETQAATPKAKRLRVTAAAATEVAAENAAEPTRKAKLTAVVSEEVVHALYQRQARLRVASGLRAGDTTLGGVVDALLREQLGLPQLQPLLVSRV